jgi:hypothetical protein
MKWIDASQGTPEHNQEVLIFFNNTHYLAVYDKEKNGFRLRDEKVIVIKPGANILWGQLIRP